MIKTVAYGIGVMNLSMAINESEMMKSSAPSRTPFIGRSENEAMIPMAPETHRRQSDSLTEKIFNSGYVSFKYGRIAGNNRTDATPISVIMPAI